MNLVIISSIFLLMKYVSLKKIVLVVGQVNKSRVLRDEAGLCGAIGQRWGDKVFPIRRE